MLQLLKRTGWPCFVLTTQHRMVNGGFDLAQEVVYRDRNHANFSKRDQESLDKELLARDIDARLSLEFRATQSPVGKGAALVCALS